MSLKFLNIFVTDVYIYNFFLFDFQSLKALFEQGSKAKSEAARKFLSDGC